MKGLNLWLRNIFHIETLVKEIQANYLETNLVKDIVCVMKYYIQLCLYSSQWRIENVFYVKMDLSFSFDSYYLFNSIDL